MPSTPSAPSEFPPQNLLSGALSPYLLQHAGNPVHWREWNPEALAEAKARGRPILLSVGYAACHWCHVMARESFADPAIAQVMNDLFVNIKVDREERPDLDRAYQAAHYLLSRRPGGWPLTMFLAPDGAPFFGGTYFPPTPRGGMPAFPDILRRVAEAWEKHRPALAEQNRELLAVLAKLDRHPHSANAPSAQILRAARDKFRAAFDRKNGGLGGAPKFPRPAELAFCLRESVAHGDDDLLDQVRLTLEKMSNGGIFDHLGGGFCRYAVDETWTIPHFEKMLYDNALLLPLLADFHIFSKKKSDAERPILRAAEMTGEWVLREMRDSRGGFWSSLDADSEGGEGRFYTWTDSQIRAALTAEEYAVAESRFGLGAGANFENFWHLTRRQPTATTARILEIPESECAARWESARKKLLRLRESRIRPGTDDKVLAGWNGLMIRGLAHAGRILEKPEWIRAARTALDFARTEMRDAAGNPAGVWRRGRVGRPVFLEDCAFLLEGALEVLMCDFSAEVLDFARELGRRMVADFADAENGGFFQTPDGWEADALIRRSMPFEDDATPSANGVAARGLLRLSWLTGEDFFAEAAEDCLRRFWESALQRPEICPTYLLALRDWLSPPPLVLLGGDATECAEWRRQLEADFPSALFFILPAEAAAGGTVGGTGGVGVPEFLRKPFPRAGARAYVCSAFSCRPPSENLEEIRGQLAESGDD